MMDAKKLAEQVLQESRLPRWKTMPLVRHIVSEMKAGDRFTSKAMISVVARQDRFVDRQAVEPRVGAALHNLSVRERLIRRVSRGVWERL